MEFRLDKILKNIINVTVPIIVGISMAIIGVYIILTTDNMDVCQWGLILMLFFMSIMIIVLPLMILKLIKDGRFGEEQPKENKSKK